MRYSIPILSLFISTAQAHSNGTQFKQWKFVRDVAGSDDGEKPEGNVYYAGAIPQTDIYSTNFTCGRLAIDSAKKTETADVIAGTEVGFRVNQGGEDSDGAEYFKIAQLAQISDNEWFVNDYNHRIVNFTIPATTPPGKYLLRFEQFWPSQKFKMTQFFINCAQVNIIGPGGGNMEGYSFAKFPGAYNYTDPGLQGNEGMYKYPREGLSRYVAPGPAVWKG
ncbi:hypothetical protein BDV95DRAFT_602847 [Massariosphaeria phaeospora]|uniref:lytic cellulose monooxygenase (C4-dehydrogenating) n=1 Tax=Massariosphaeria phaeospora TaxID=100035 RepID=A0A7C8IEV9_9PLEO|nr:hypothetical protein BDV95DRAFT_602847 [Massariosphaeria phaeospora]